jgi:hypothetical protein
MSRIQMLNGVARNVAHKFSASANHFAYMAYMHKIQSIRIDLLSGVIKPEIFHIDRNNNLVEMCMINLQTMLSGVRVNAEMVKEAYLDIYFEIPSYTINENILDQIQCEFEVNLILVNGRQFIGIIRENVIMQS